MRRLVTMGALADHSPAARRAVTSALAQMARSASPADLSALFSDVHRLAGLAGLPPPGDDAAAAWEPEAGPGGASSASSSSSAARDDADDDGDSDDEGVDQGAAAAAVLALSRSLDGPRLEAAREALFPAAFLGSHGATAPLWRAAAEALTPGAASAAVRRAAPRVVLAARAALRSRVWARRRAGASALAAAVRILAPAELRPLALLDGASGSAYSPARPVAPRVARRDGSVPDGPSAELDGFLPVTLAPGSAALAGSADPWGLLPPGSQPGAGSLRQRGGAVCGLTLAVPALAAGRARGPLSSALAALRGRWWDGKEAVLDAAAACLAAGADDADGGWAELAAQSLRAATRSSATPVLARAAALRALAVSVWIPAVRRAADGAGGAAFACGEALMSCASAVEAGRCGRLGREVAVSLRGGEEAAAEAGDGAEALEAEEEAAGRLGQREAALLAAALQAACGTACLSLQAGGAEGPVLATRAHAACLVAMTGRGRGGAGSAVAAPAWSLRLAAAQASAMLAAVAPGAGGGAAPGASSVLQAAGMCRPSATEGAAWPGAARLIAARCAAVMHVVRSLGGAADGERAGAAISDAAAEADRASLPLVASALRTGLGTG